VRHAGKSADIHPEANHSIGLAKTLRLLKTFKSAGRTNDTDSGCRNSLVKHLGGKNAARPIDTKFSRYM